MPELVKFRHIQFLVALLQSKKFGKIYDGYFAMERCVDAKRILFFKQYCTHTLDILNEMGNLI